jgi:hypothetical protein
MQDGANQIQLTGVLLGLLGVVVGWLLGLATNISRDFLQRRRENQGVRTALYCEIADRAARCVSDFINPWQHYLTPQSEMTAHRIGKFLPAKPVMYSQLAAKLALARPAAIAPILRFYFRLDALRREVESFKGDFDPHRNLIPEHSDRVELVARRFPEVAGPALLALKKLNVRNWEMLDQEAAEEYRHLRESGKTLREALEDCARAIQ